MVKSVSCHYHFVKYCHVYYLALSVNFSQTVYSVDEDKGPVQPVLTLSVLSTIDITVKVFSNDGSATGKNMCISISVCVAINII